MSVLFAGDNSFKQMSSIKMASINHPQTINIDFSQVISYSIYRTYSVIVLTSGIPCAIGNNTGWPIHESLPRMISEWTSFIITDNQTREYFVESAVCGSIYTLYKLRLRTPGSESCLALVKKGKSKGKPFFLNTGNWIPMSLYGGKDISAAIDEKGAIHIIDNTILTRSDYSTKVLFLPNNDLPISVCFCDDSIFALSGQKIVYEFKLSDFDQNKREFQKTIELNRINIISIYGVSNHCIAVSLNGEVFVRGSNEDGQLGLGKETKETKKFVKLMSLNRIKIKDAFAGSFHSLFVDENGKVFSCGNNKFGELLIGNSFGQKVYQPVMTSIKSKANFCVSGFHVSVVFVDCLPPLNSPNQTLRLKSPYPFPQLFESSNSSDSNESNEKLLEEIRKLKQTVLEQAEANELLNEIMTSQIDEFVRLNKENEKMKKVLQSKQIEVDFDSDDSNTNESNEDNNNNDNNDNDDLNDIKDKEPGFNTSIIKKTKEKSVDKEEISISDDDDIEYVDDDENNMDNNSNSIRDKANTNENEEKKLFFNDKKGNTKDKKSENVSKEINKSSINKFMGEKNQSKKLNSNNDDFDYEYIEEEEEVKDENIKEEEIKVEKEKDKDNNDNKNEIIDINDDDDVVDEDDYDDNPADFSD